MAEPTPHERSVILLQRPREQAIARTLADALGDGLARLDAHAAVVVIARDGEQRIGRAALLALVDHVRETLVGAQPGDRVEIATGGVEAFAPWIAAVQAGLVPTMTVGAPGIRVVATDDAGREHPVALVQRTSGSTDVPKTIVVSPRAVLAQAWGLSHALDLRDDDVIASCLPLHHDMGLVSTVLLPLLCGLSVVHVDPASWRADPRALLDAIAQHRATRTWLPPAALARLQRCATTWRGDLGSLREIVCGGDVLDPATRDAFESSFAVHGLAAGVVRSGWGMAENVAAVTHGRRGRALGRIDVAWDSFAPGHVAVRCAIDAGVALLSVGEPIAGTEVRVAGAASEGTLGVLEIRGDCLSDPTAWHATGDAGLLVDGEVYVCGRMADLVEMGGRWIPPHMIELAASRIPGVRAGRVAALRDRDGGCIVAIEHEGPLDENAVAQAITAAVGRTPRVCVVPPDTLVRTTSGKLARGPTARALGLVPHDP